MRKWLFPDLALVGTNNLEKEKYVESQWRDKRYNGATTFITITFSMTTLRIIGVMRNSA
jgi:hypothetical protein